jgi:hypothetical protein
MPEQATTNDSSIDGAASALDDTCKIGQTSTYHGSIEQSIQAWNRRANIPIKHPADS